MKSTAVFIILVMLSPFAHADRSIMPELIKALDDHDFDSLREIRSSSKSDSLDYRIADAVTYSMLGLDESAERKLEALVDDDIDPRIVARAKRSLSGVFVRQGRYGDAADVMKEVIDMPGEHGVTIDPGSMAFFKALSPVDAMISSAECDCRSTVSRDKINLPRIRITVNGFSDEAIFDTGAAFSTVSLTMAEKMRLQPLQDKVEVSGSTDQLVETGIAVAKELLIDGARFHNVPFIVVADEDLTFSNVDYSISSILGLPVIRDMGRLEFSNERGQEMLSFGATASHPDPERANLITSGWQLVFLAQTGSSERRLRYFLDSGATTSALLRLSAELVPDLIEGAGKGTASYGGVGGEIFEKDVLVVDSTLMKIGSNELGIGPINVLDDDGSQRHGIVGQDILSPFETLILDFDAMNLELLR